MKRKISFILIVIGVTLFTVGGCFLVKDLTTHKKVNEAPVIEKQVPTKEDVLPVKQKVKEPVYSLDAADSYLLTLVNNRRKDAGVPLVIELTHIDYGAYNRCVYLIEKQQWSHDGFAEALYGSLWNPSGTKIGEDLARNFNSEEAVVNAWMNSPKHREIMLDKDYKYMGFGHYQSYWTLWMSTRP